jgi:D-alanyl-D-alanine dipeptidase
MFKIARYSVSFSKFEIMRLLLILILLGLTVACHQKSEGIADKSVKRRVQENHVNEGSTENNAIQTVSDSILDKLNLVDVQKLNSAIYVDLKYAGTENFLKTKVYERIQKAYLQRDVAERLARCQDYLRSIDSTLHLLIYDAMRPIEIQKKMWDELDSIPSYERGKYVSNPLNKSLHNYGAAVDLTICKNDGSPLDMGADFDEFSEKAQPSKELQMMAKGLLSQEQINNRLLLRKVMRKEGFRNLPTEWWHFNACSRNDASKKYQVIEEEP